MNRQDRRQSVHFPGLQKDGVIVCTYWDAVAWGSESSFLGTRASLPLQHPLLSTHFHTFIPERIQAWEACDVFSTSASKNSHHGRVHKCTHTQHTLWALVISGPALLLYPTAVHRAPSFYSAFLFHAWLLLGKPFLPPWVISSTPKGSYKSSVLFF